MKACLATMFKVVRHERSIILLLSLTDILKQSKFTDAEINIIRNLALEKLHRQRILKEHVGIVRKTIFQIINEYISKFE